MERVKVYVISALFVIMCLMPCAGVCEEPEPSLSTLITPQNVAFEDCTRTFNMNSDRLFYLTLAAVNANRFEIKEIQSKTGYVLFSAVGKEFLASIVSIDKYRSMLKSTPATHNYFFAPGIVLNMYKYIDVNTSEHLQNIPKGG